MFDFNDLQKEIIDFLKTYLNDESINIIKAFPNEKSSFPLEKRTITVGIFSIENKQISLGNVLNDNQNIYGAKVKISLDVFCSKYCGGADALNRIVNDVFNTMLKKNDLIFPISLNFEKIKYDRDKMLFSCHGQMEAEIVYNDNKLFDQLENINITIDI